MLMVVYQNSGQAWLPIIVARKIRPHFERGVTAGAYLAGPSVMKTA